MDTTRSTTAATVDCPRLDTCNHHTRIRYHFRTGSSITYSGTPGRRLSWVQFELSTRNDYKKASDKCHYNTTWPTYRFTFIENLCDNSKDNFVLNDHAVHEWAMLLGCPIHIKLHYTTDYNSIEIELPDTLTLSNQQTGAGYTSNFSSTNIHQPHINKSEIRCSAIHEVVLTTASQMAAAAVNH